jgi:hypothetical protein
MILHGRKKRSGRGGGVNSAALGGYDKNRVAAGAGLAFRKPGMKRRRQIASCYRRRLCRLTSGAASFGSYDAEGNDYDGGKRRKPDGGLA